MFALNSLDELGHERKMLQLTLMGVSGDYHLPTKLISHQLDDD